MSLNWYAEKVTKSALVWCPGSNEKCVMCREAIGADKAKPHFYDHVQRFCFILMAIGYNSIKNEAAAQEVYARFLIMRRLDLSGWAYDGWSQFITPDFLRAMIGYSTNVTTESRAQFIGRHRKFLESDANRAARDAFAPALLDADCEPV